MQSIYTITWQANFKADSHEHAGQLAQDYILQSGRAGGMEFQVDGPAGPQRWPQDEDGVVEIDREPDTYFVMWRMHHPYDSYADAAVSGFEVLIEGLMLPLEKRMIRSNIEFWICSPDPVAEFERVTIVGDSAVVS